MRFPSLSDLTQEIALAARSLRRAWGFTVTAVGSLAFGLALVACALAVVNAYLLRAMPYPDARRIFHLRYAAAGPQEPRGMTALDWNSLGDVVDATIIATGEALFLPGAGYAQQLRGSRVSPGYVAGLGVRPAAGRVFNADEYRSGAEPVVMISHALWRDHFASDPQVVGRMLHSRPEDPAAPPQAWRVVGVLPAGFWFGRDSNDKVDFLTPLRVPTRAYLVRLREGVSLERARQRITAAVRAIGTDFPPNWQGVELESIHARYSEAVRPALTGIGVAALLLLVLVVANVAILVLLRAMRRQKEMAVRVALGAGRWQLVRLLTAETALICTAAGILAVLVSAVALRLLAPAIEEQLGKSPPHGSASLSVDATVLLGIGAACAVLVFALGWLPLLAPWQWRLADALRREGASGTDGPMLRRLRSGLIVAEVAGSLVLLVGCGLMLRSAINLMRTNLGHRTEHVLRTRVVLPVRGYETPAAAQAFYTRLIERLNQDARVPLSLNGPFPPYFERYAQPFEAEDARTADPSVPVAQVGAGHFDLMGVEVLQGRAFTPADRFGSEPVAILSETLAAKLWPAGTAVGRRIRTAPQPAQGEPALAWRTVVGVVRDVRQTYGDSDLRDVYLPYLQNPVRFASLEARTTQTPEQWAQLLRVITGEIDPFARVSAPAPVTSEDRQRARTRFVTTILTAFGGFAAALAVLGIYGVTAYAAAQREREVAIRIALGAPASAIVRMFLRDGGRVIALGLVVGMGGALGAARVLESLVHGVSPFDVTTLMATGVFLAAAGIAAIWWPVRGTAQQDPMLVLKEG